MGKSLKKKRKGQLLTKGEEGDWRGVSLSSSNNKERRLRQIQRKKEKMGQYYVVANFDRKEYICTWNLGVGAKLTEFGWRGNRIEEAMKNLLATRWAGERVAVVGDYAECDNKEDCFFKTLKKLQDEFCAPKPFVHDRYETLYSAITDGFTEISDRLPSFPSSTDASYLINDKKKLFVDLNKLPVSYVLDGEKWQLSPIVFLLAMGNGRGGGDYRGPKDIKKVGEWSKDIGFVRCSNSVPEGYKEKKYKFVEK